MPANQDGRFLCRIFGNAILRAGQLMKIEVLDRVIIVEWPENIKNATSEDGALITFENVSDSIYKVIILF
jgi:tRNA A37 threonylcarbamoyladenosine biosynthesis protein TsaE